jgi:hypothetical protein
MKEDRPSGEGGPRPVPPIYRVGETIIFNYEGNIRATVEGYEVIEGKVWLECRALLSFTVPQSRVVGVEREE